MRARLLALAAGAVFLSTALRHLDVVPRVFEDEPWQASTAAKLAAHALFGTDLFAGYFHMEQRYYDFLPLNPLIEAAVFKAAGVGLLQARLETVAATLLTLALTWWLGVRVAGAWVGALAVVLLVFVRWSGGTYVLLTGIPTVDLARIARYDPLVPVFGLAALHVYLSARRHATGRVAAADDRGASERDPPPLPPVRGWRFGLAGALAGLAGLAHVYGLFTLGAVAVLVAWDLRPRRQAAMALGWLGLGAALVWLPYAAYVLSDLPDWRGQTLGYADRFDLLDVRWYVSNVLDEVHRYRPGLGPFGIAWLGRPGTWFMLLGVPLALGWLGRRALGRAGPGHVRDARLIFVPAVLWPLLFALLITSKVVNYTTLELPVIALALGWAVVAAYRAAAHARWLRAVVALGLLAVVAEGSLRLLELEQAAHTTTPYPAFSSALRRLVPTGARVLGLHTYWFGMEDLEYRSFLLPLYLADAGLPLDQALDRVAPDIVMLDPRVREYFDAPTTAPDRAKFERWLAEHAARRLGEVDDVTYGLIEVYAVARSPAASATGPIDRAF